MQITRYMSLNEVQFLGCVSAFIDSLNGELNAALMFLRKLEHQGKGSAFAFEMQFDKHRYGAMMVLDRWADFARAFRGNVELGMHQSLFDGVQARVESAGNLLTRVNEVIDASESYGSAVVEACQVTYQTVLQAFSEERIASEKAMSLGPLLPEEFKEFRRVFLADLAAR